MREVIGLRLPDELHDTVADEARRRGVSLQTIIRQRLEERYDELRAEEEIKEKIRRAQLLERLAEIPAQ